jgi:hypothetical protein
MANRITITIDTGNDAFYNGYGNERVEVARILRDLASVYLRGNGPPAGFERRLLDENGEQCGMCKVKVLPLACKGDTVK